MKKSVFFILIVVAIIFRLSFVVNGYEHALSFSDNHNYLEEKPDFIVKALKYDNYPVSPGNWFNVWIKVENVGQQDAPNMAVRLEPNFPFVGIENLTQNYGIISGVVNASINKKYRQETSLQGNQVVLRYRVKVAGTAEEGTYNLKLMLTSDMNKNIYKVFYLPIVINKTKTVFEVTSANLNPWGTDFGVSNIGNKLASAVTVRLLGKKGLDIKGADSVLVGNLESGDFTRVSFDFLPEEDVRNVTLQISYTDLAGVRNMINKSILINPNLYNVKKEQVLTSSFSKSEWIYSGAGLILGILVSFVLFPRKGKNPKKEE